jgi:hypothetical protein
MLRIALAVPVLALVLGAAACQNGAPPPAPTGTAMPSPNETHGDDMYQEAAARFSLPQQTIERAVVDARVEMLAKGGPEGKALRDGGFLDPAIMGLFAERLAVPADRAEQVMRFLIEEWDEYDEEAEQRSPGGHAEWVAYVAEQLEITPARAEWLGRLLFSRPFVADTAQTWDRIFLAIARDVGVTPQRLAEVVDGLKNRL